MIWLGHGADYKVVNFVVEALPDMITDLALTAAVVTAIEEILVRCIPGSDNRITADSINFFPKQIFGLTDEKIRNTINDPETGHSYLHVRTVRLLWFF